MFPDGEVELPDCSTIVTDYYMPPGDPFNTEEVPSPLEKGLELMWSMLAMITGSAGSGEDNGGLNQPRIITGSIDDETGQPDAHEMAEQAKRFDEQHASNEDGCFFDWQRDWVDDEEEKDLEINSTEPEYSDEINTATCHSAVVMMGVVQAPKDGDKAPEGESGSGAQGGDQTSSALVEGSCPDLHSSPSCRQRGLP